MMSSSFTKMIRRISATMVMMGIENEETMPNCVPPLPHGCMSPVDRSLCRGKGSTDIIRSANEMLLIFATCPHRVSDMTNAVFLSNLRRPAGVVSIGKPMRMGRAGASGSKNAAIWNATLDSLTSGGVSFPQLGRSSTHRMVNHTGACELAYAWAVERIGNGGLGF